MVEHDRDNHDIPAQPVSALMMALVFTLAEMEPEGAEAFLGRMEWWLGNPCRDLPSLLLDEERLVRRMLQTLREVEAERRRELSGS